MTTDQRTAILAAESRSAALRVELAKLQADLAASNREVARLYRDARRVVRQKRTPTRDKIMAYITSRKQCRFTLQGVAKATGISFIATHSAVCRMAKAGILDRLARGVYGLPKKDVAAE